MKGQKQSRTDNLEKRVAAMTNVIQALIKELDNLKYCKVYTSHRIARQFNEKFNLEIIGLGDVFDIQEIFNKAS